VAITPDRDRPGRPFDAAEFVELMNRGVYDGRVTEQVEKLSYEHLEQVALLMAKRRKEKRGL
jgi:hypothetical protein